jgi:hypothetical protein
LNSILHS